MADNYSSVTQKSYLSHTTPTGREPLPYTTLQNGTGFSREKAVTVPNSAQVNLIEFLLQSGFDLTFYL